MVLFAQREVEGEHILLQQPLIDDVVHQRRGALHRHLLIPQSHDAVEGLVENLGNASEAQVLIVYNKGGGVLIFRLDHAVGGLVGLVVEVDGLLAEEAGQLAGPE